MERISHYRLVARLGKGAMGEVWRAVDERLGRAVALKLLPVARSTEQKMQARLLREAQAASALNHPGIVTVHDVGSWHGQIFMVMELVDGEPLSELVRRGVPPTEALRLVADAAEALAAAHARDILHRDIKSDNLMRTHDGRIKVLDFGLAKLRAAPEAAESATSSPASLHGVQDLAAVAETLDSTPQSGAPSASGGAPPTDPEALRQLHGGDGAHVFPPLSTPSSPSSSESLTMAGALVGTPVYMAPEQTDGTAGDPQSEVWSLGVVLYELLCGKRPFERASIPEVLQAIRTQPIVPPSQAAPSRGIPARLDAVVLKALSRDRAARYADMRAFAAALKQARRRLGGTHTGAEPSLPSTSRFVAVGAGVLALFCAVGGWAYFTRRPPPPPPPSKPELPSVTVTGTRRITFDVGCEEYPSFTPDGRTVVFDGVMENDYELGALDLASGATGRLTHEPGWDYGGAVSPDGKSIAYVHTSDAGREIRVLPIEGDRQAKPMRLGLAASGFPSWTSDGAVLVGQGDEIMRFTIDPRGIKRERVGRLPQGAVDRYVAQFADGNLVALWQPQYAANDVTVGEIGKGGVARAVETLPMDSIGLIVAPSQAAYFYGRHHANANELVRRRFGGAAERVAGDVTPASGLSISPDGKHLAYSTCRESAVIARVRTGKPAEPLMAAGSWRDIWPAPVDDGRLLFESDRAGAMQVWMLDGRTHETRPLAKAPSGHPAVSPDGKWLAYAGGAEPGIHVVPVGGGAAKRVTEDADDGEPAFAFDGKTIVFESTRDHVGARVYAVAIAGGAARAISPVGALCPAASPTENRVVFVMPTDKGRLLMSTTLDGKSAAPLVGVASGDWLNPRFSRDGKKLLVVRKTAEVVEIELATGAARVVYQAGLDGIGEATYAPDGDGLIASVQLWSGDLWLADGTFR
ncbi:MAG TPA: protein kinase [Polyangia bacterium]|nr:protein kinase [Polyangia bacterium]